MRPVSLFVFFVVSHLGIFHLAEAETNVNNSDCQPFPCGKLGNITFPFRPHTPFPHCGLLAVDGCLEDTQKIQLEEGGGWFMVEYISPENSVFIHDEAFSTHLNSRSCETFNNLTFYSSPLLSIQITSNLTMMKCDPGVHSPPNPNFTYTGCSDFTILYNPELKHSAEYHPWCKLLQLPVPANRDPSRPNEDIFSLLTASFEVDVIVSRECKECHHHGGHCLTGKKGEFQCSRKEKKKLALPLGLGFGVPIIMTLVVFVFVRRHKKRHGSAKLLSTSSNSDPSSKEDLERGSVYFGVPVFSYSELEEATNNFSSENELGDGGFGTVYYGKLKDTREVAVKRMYEHNFRRVEQFMNEIEILTRMRHRNLVSLYGCTSRRSKELLLVYEYIPNGTVADHLHGDRAKSDPMTWPIRLNIAIETASALAYLHASDIIHRDVKTNNILLDKNFSVKVADFGLSRLFPHDVTHVSTCPQGTPGYIDPEYYQCYQLTDKSDVYSFGVVLIELISSMPAVDITRDRSDINLANLAIKRIQKCEFDELIDPFIEYKSNEEIKRMATCVAKLAFRCLQQDKDMRPTMVNVLKELKTIQSGDSEKNLQEFDNMDDELKNRLPTPSPQECDEDALLKNIRLPLSPISVTDKWASSSSAASNVSG